MTYLIWRLHRGQVLVTSALLTALTVLLVVTGLVMAHDYHTALANCGLTQSCGDLGSELFRGDGAIIDLVNLTAVIPLLLGIFYGAPIVAKEIEDGTHNLAWTQGVTRRQWLLSNVGCMLLAAAVWGTLLSVLVSWWRGPENALGSRFDTFDIQGIVPIAYAVAAVAVGIAVGALVRRLLPAIAITLAAFLTLRLPVALYLRPHFMTPLRAVGALSRGTDVPSGSWVLSSYLVAPNGQTFAPGISLGELPAACRPDPIAGKGLSAQCLGAHGFHSVTTYQPLSRFWAFQGIESAIFLALAVLALAVAYRSVVRRDA